MKYLFLFASFLLIQSTFSQSKLPVIKATSSKVSVNDGGLLDKDRWTLTPSARPDVFTADRTRETKWVTFYTDIDSIRVKVKPGTKFDFIILLNGKDSCYTRIASAIPADISTKTATLKNDTIPFTLTAFNSIQIKSVINDTDTLNLAFDASSYAFHLTRDAILKKTKLLSNQPDAVAGKTAPNFNKLNKVDKIQIGSLVLNNPDVLPTPMSGHEMDGRIGWDIFENKKIEIDYDKNLLIVYAKLPKTDGYVKSKIGFIRSFPYIKGTFEIAGKQYSGDFLMDTGSDQALILDSAWASDQNFPKDLKLIKSSVLRDPRGVKYETRIVLTPALRLNGFLATDIPAFMLGGRNPVGFSINYLGNDLLKRFNMILDFEKDNVYLKPNKLMGVKYLGNS